MPYQRKDKDGNVTKEHATRQPTAEEAEEQKQERVAEQNKAREEFEKGRKPVEPKIETPAAKPSTAGSGSKSQSVSS